ncbi:MAG: hypothetical protein JXA90_15480, partial [Planctomycetes bacterium]|nr:hypothetical protein [Planctomycetota bacterium]
DATFAEGASALPGGGASAPADRTREAGAAGPAEEGAAPPASPAETDKPPPAAGESPADGGSSSLAEAGSEPGDRTGEPGTSPGAAEEAAARPGISPADGAKEPGAPAGERDARRADRRRGVHAALLWLSAIVVCLVTAIVIRAARRSRCRRRATGGSAPRVERRAGPLELDDTIGGATAADLDARLGPDHKGARAEEAERPVRRASREAEELARAGDERGALLAPLDIPDGEGEQEDLDPGAAPGRRT